MGSNCSQEKVPEGNAKASTRSGVKFKSILIDNEWLSQSHDKPAANYQ